jgi:cytochrome P450 family 26 subfamily A
LKTLTFNLICSVLLGIENGKQSDQFINPFQAMMRGMVSVPINIPFTSYNRSLKASARIQNMLKEIVHQKTVEQEKSGVNPRQDLISCMLSMVEDDKQVLTEKEIIHNAMLVMVGGYDTSSVLITFIIRVLANEPAICAAVLQGMHRCACACVCVRER